MARSAAPRTETGRGSSAWLTVSAAVLALMGALTLFYGPIFPPPYLADVALAIPIPGFARLPIYWLIVGSLGIVAAVGVARRRDWGRILGIALSGWGLLTLAVVFVRSGGSDPLSAALEILIVFVLWRSWPAASEGS
jgi:hypothetical protein